MNKADPPANAFVPDMAGTTARTGAEEAIEALRARGGVFVDAVRATRIAMVLTDPTLPGNPIVFANQAFLELSGYTMDEVLGQQPYFMNGRRTDAADADNFRRALEEDRDVVIETVQYRKDESRFTATVLLSGFKDDDGTTLNHFLSWMDVSRRVEAEQEVIDQREMNRALRDSEEKYRSLFETMGQGYCELELVRDAEGRAVDQFYLEFNPAFEHLFGISAAQARGRKASEVFPGLEPSWTEACDRVAKSGTSERIEYRIAALDRWFEVYAYPGRGDRVVTLYEDVTERKRIEIALRESEDQLRLIVENARDYAIFTMDLAGFVTDWREGAEAVFGFAHDEIVGRDARILFTPEDNAAGEPDRELALAARTGKAPNVRWHVCKDGRRVFIEGVCTALFDGAGRPTGFLKIGRDATERRAGEERQRVLLGELQHRVRNILSVVRSVFSRTLQGEGSLEDMAEHFQGRLDALARTQVVVTQNPHGTADLENLVREELLSVAARDGLQLSLDGPEVELSGEAAEALGLAVHELTTNSLKYGALRFPGARLTIRWSLDNVDYSGPARLVFMWEEQGVPAMPVNPVREGFGTELITRALPYRLGAKTGFELRPGGIRCTIDLPLPKATVPSGAS